MNKYTIQKDYDVVVVGGGISGICAALASARHGIKTCLVHNRPVLGGNASSEIKMHICGALGLDHNRQNARETGIIEEIQLENQARNPQHSFSIFDTILWEKIRFQKNLDLFLNNHLTEVCSEGGLILEIKTEILTAETVMKIKGKLFIDTTGDATLAYLAGAEYMKGREGKSDFNEYYAPENSDDETMGNTLLFESIDMQKPISFKKPDWAYSFSEEDLTLRGHEEISSGYWWIELGGGDTDTITDAEEIRDELLKSVYGIWDHIKNAGPHGAENLALNWVGFLPGKRESRRVTGDYILKEEDLIKGKIFNDAVAFGGWPIDLHVSKGLLSRKSPTKFIPLNKIYTIPYRCLYSNNVKNLFVGGRAISATHIAFGSTRVMGTCAVIGQAIGTAAAIAINRGLLPGEMAPHIEQLRQALLSDDCFIPNLKSVNSNNLAGRSKVSCSSSDTDNPCINIINGYFRSSKDNSNCWVSKPSLKKTQWVCLEFNNKINPDKIDLRFDSNLSSAIMLSLSQDACQKHSVGIPEELVKEYTIEIFLEQKTVYRKTIKNNFLRHRIHVLPPDLICDSLKIIVHSTHGTAQTRIFEVGVYGKSGIV